MKKVLSILAIAVFLICPSGAVAYLVDTGTLDMDYSGLTQAMDFPSISPGTYYADYDAEYTLLGQTYYDEIFCVEDAYGIGSTNPYDFYTIDSSLVSYGLSSERVDEYIKATWVAYWFSESPGSEMDKAVAQVAIWEIVLETEDVGNYNLSSGNLQAGSSDIKTAAQTLLYGAFATALVNETWDDYAGDWLLAVNPTGLPIKEGDTFQNYLVPNPIPEPATMVLFGTGLIGMAGLGRKKFKK